MKAYFEKYQHSDFDNDLEGITLAIIDWMRYLKEQGVDEVELTQPERFTKMHPHFPQMERRKSARNMLADAMKSDESTLLNNIYVGIIAVTYLYHLPTEKMIEASTAEFTRPQVREMLLADNCPEQILQEDSGKDYTAIYVQ